jgi:tetratricopeptide (TPR) repeat protein
VDKAKAAWKQAIQIGNNPADPEPRCYALTQAANLFFHLGDYDGADAGYASALKECANYPHAMLGKGKVALAKGEPVRAVSWLEQGVKQSESIELRWRLGDALVADGKPERAESVFAELISAGREEDPRTTAQFLAAHNREPALAVELARKELKTRGGIYAADALAFALYRANELEEAAKLVDQMLALKTPDSAIEYHAGAILLARGETERGIALLKSALARNPKFDAIGAADAERLLTQAERGAP